MKNKNIINFNSVKKKVKQFNNIKIHVGILSDRKAKEPKTPHKFKGLTPNFSTGQKALHSGKNSKLTLKKLALMLDKKYKIFSSFNRRAKNKFYKKLVDELSKDITKLNKLKIQKLAVNALKYQILKYKFKPNTNSTAKSKGFNKPMIRTGTFYNNIKAKVNLK